MQLFFFPVAWTRPPCWRSLAPKAAAASRVALVDGVRRIDALVWITGDDGATRLGLCASVAAGVVEAGTTAVVTDVEWIAASLKVFGIFLPGTVRVYPIADAAKARLWITQAT